MIGPSDEELHASPGAPHWQESFYFNWADPRGAAFGLTRIGLRPASRRVDALVVSLRDGRPEYVYPGVGLRLRGRTPRARDGIRGGRLAYRMLEPLRSWRLVLEGRQAMDLVWTTTTPPFDYAAAGRELPPDVAHAHFEQAGRVSGTTRFGGRELVIEGTGERDKSWGVRDWARVEGWSWISAQFGDGLAFNVWEGAFGGRVYTNGYVHRDGESRALERASIAYAWGEPRYSPRAASLELHDAVGRRLSVRAEALARFPLFKSGLWLEEVHAKFTAEGAGAPRTGIGVIERAQHVGWRALGRAKDALGALREGVWR